MEVACGEYGDHYMRLAMAARRGTLDEIVDYLKKTKVFPYSTVIQTNECPIDNIQIVSETIPSSDHRSSSPSSPSFCSPIIIHDDKKKKTKQLVKSVGLQTQYYFTFVLLFMTARNAYSECN